jgi:hypothetical protein
MKGNEAQVIVLDGENSPERARDSYRVDGIAFSSFLLKISHLS